MGPLSGIKVVELAGIGPAPMSAMLLADMGATVIRVDRLEWSGLGIKKPSRFVTNRGRPIIGLDIKTEAGRNAVLQLVAGADVLIEGFRPGVMERLGLGPEVCLAENPQLVYGRVTGWGQDGPLAHSAGHDLNYLAISGALAAIGRRGQPPTPPLALVGDFAGGGLYLTLGILSALLEARSSDKGQVVDAAMLDGVSSLMTTFYGLFSAGLYTEERGNNAHDGGNPFYDVYLCADDKYVSIAPLERKFRTKLCDAIGYVYKDEIELMPESQIDRDRARARLAAIFLTRSRDEWSALLEGTDACFAPVLTMSEAPSHPHNMARGVFAESGGVVQPVTAPRFSRTASGPLRATEAIGETTDAALAEWGFKAAEIDSLRQEGILL